MFCRYHRHIPLKYYIVDIIWSLAGSTQVNQTLYERCYKLDVTLRFTFKRINGNQRIMQLNLKRIGILFFIFK